jgi:tRNA-dihydrouridine synthase B
MLKIGNITLDMPFFQAPLSGYTDHAMRKLAREMGCPLTFTGVLLDKIAVHAKAVKKLKFQPGLDEHPVGAQILGAAPDMMAKAAAGFERICYDLIDLNFACPAPKVLRRRRGGFMLNEPMVAMEIFQKVREAVKCPVTVKIRTCFSKNDGTVDNFWQICEGLNNEGVDAITIHGRAVKEMYRGKANWEIVKQAKEKFPNTVIIGSGDILDAESAIDRYESTGIDGVVIARGAIGNPWIFNEVRALFEKKKMPEKPTLQEQGLVMLRHFEMLAKLKTQSKAVPYFRKFSAKYCKRHPERKKVLMALLGAKTRRGVHDVIKQWYGVGIDQVTEENIAIGLPA